MNNFELQTRANLIVDKVNEYEASLVGVEIDEQDILNQHIYADLFCLRAVIKLIFAKDMETRLSRTVANDKTLSLYTSFPLQDSMTFDFFTAETTREYLPSYLYQNVDMYNAYRMYTTELPANTEYSDDVLTQQGIKYAMSASIKDALVTECQLANVFKWNTADDDEMYTWEMPNDFALNRQVPGVVLYYLGPDYSGTYTATVPFNSTRYFHGVNDTTPPLYGAYYDSTNIDKSQVGLDMTASSLRMFMPGTTYFNKGTINPSQIYQPYVLVGDTNTGYGYNQQGYAIYHELVFKQRRAGCKDAGVDFIPALEEYPDNDPQGLASRLALAQTKDYYYHRPFFNSLNEYYSTDGNKQALLADKIVELTTGDNLKTDAEFYNSFQLDYETFATALNKDL